MPRMFGFEEIWRNHIKDLSVIIYVCLTKQSQIKKTNPSEPLPIETRDSLSIDTLI